MDQYIWCIVARVHYLALSARKGESIRMDSEMTFNVVACTIEKAMALVQANYEACDFISVTRVNRVHFAE